MDGCSHCNFSQSRLLLGPSLLLWWLRSKRTSELLFDFRGLNSLIWLQCFINTEQKAASLTPGN